MKTVPPAHPPSTAQALFSVARTCFEPPGKSLTLTSIAAGVLKGEGTRKATEQMRAAWQYAYNDCGGGAEGLKAAKVAITPMKENSPVLMMAGCCTGSKFTNAAWSSSSGMVGVDLDNLKLAEAPKVRDHLATFDWVAAAWVSPSGRGVKALVYVGVIDPLTESEYHRYWHEVTAWLAEIGYVNDRQTKNPSRLCFLSHDPDGVFKC